MKRRQEDRRRSPKGGVGDEDGSIRGESRPVRGRFLGSLLLLTILAACGDSPEGSLYRGYDLVLINIETLRTDFVGCYGLDENGTPELDSLAAQGIVVEDSYTVAPWTRPSVASLWTGLYPSHHGVDTQDPEVLLPENATTLAEILAAEGYRTFGAVTNSNLASELGFAQGFEEYH